MNKKTEKKKECKKTQSDCDVYLMEGEATAREDDNFINIFFLSLSIE